MLVYEHIQYYYINAYFIYQNIYESRIFHRKTEISQQEYFIAYEAQEIF